MATVLNFRPNLALTKVEDRMKSEVFLKRYKEAIILPESLAMGRI